MRRAGAFLLVGLVGLAAACESGSLTYERMIEQPRVQLFDESPVFEDRRAMRPPPAGTVPTQAAGRGSAYLEGVERGTFAQAIPGGVAPERLALGRALFHVHCAPCHGARADGRSAIARFMVKKPPANLLAPPVAGYPPGRVFATTSRGYRFMRPYLELSVDERWAIVAHVESLPPEAGGVQPGPAEPAEPGPWPTDTGTPAAALATLPPPSGPPAGDASPAPVDGGAP